MTFDGLDGEEQGKKGVYPCYDRGVDLRPMEQQSILATGYFDALFYDYASLLCFQTLESCLCYFRNS